MKTLIIAEVGVNHNGDIALAKKLIAAASEAGADLVKFQTFTASNLVTVTAPKADYQKRRTAGSENQFDMIKKLELSRSDHATLIAECRAHGVEFFSTAFDHRSFDLLMELGCLDRIKVPSGELTNLPLLRYISRFSKPLLLSTGMACLGEVEAAIGVIEASGTPRHLITILHCTTEYPAPMDEVNLHALVTLKKAFGCRTGYSDHTLGIEIPIAAVALGAAVIEKHFTLDRNLPGPDQNASLEPHEFKEMVRGIRNIESALGDGIKRPSPSELKNILIARKSVVAVRDIRAGEIFNAENIGVKRPGTGISPMRWDEVIGRKAPRDFSLDERIEI
ncbi:N-acetylneuraminate synthase [Gammaproteobacteria bacterium]|nr:N-acetylneuraminate synthase [Gammaproteobacteria bacterium]